MSGAQGEKLNLVQTEVLNHFETERRHLLIWTIVAAAIGAIGIMFLFWRPGPIATLLTVVGLVGYRECRVRAMVLDQIRTGAVVQFSLISELDKVKLQIGGLPSVSAPDMWEALHPKK